MLRDGQWVVLGKDLKAVVIVSLSRMIIIDKRGGDVLK
jgi:hypothetical protein